MDKLEEEEIKPYEGYTWIVRSAGLLGGKPTIKGTRISVAQVLECLSIGMTPQKISHDYPGFPEESVSEVLKFAANHINNVAA
ncbi:MAG: DUF433 domain-containing protein [Halobacteriovoraceae bacterium]|nr:DUF433 domain-containing protein [Halobacteriovoraceae bacterium]